MERQPGPDDRRRFTKTAEALAATAFFEVVALGIGVSTIESVQQASGNDTMKLLIGGLATAITAAAGGWEWRNFHQLRGERSR